MERLTANHCQQEIEQLPGCVVSKYKRVKTMRSLFHLLLVGILGLSASQVTFAQRPFENVRPGEAADAEGQDEDERPVRPIDRRPSQNQDRPKPDRPEDDELDFNRPRQTTSVNEQYAGWQEAGDFASDNRVGDTLRANWVMADRNGEFRGTVRGIDSTEVAGMTIYLMNRGRLVKSTAVQGDGSFIFSNVQRGSYSMVGWGDKAFFAFGLNILSFNRDVQIATPKKMTINAFQNATTINTDWIRYYAPNISYRVYGKFSVEEGEDDPAKLYGFDGLTRYQPDAVPATSVGATPVSLSATGALVGRVHQMDSLSGRPVEVRSTKVMLMKNDEVVASTTTDNFGVFGMPGVQPGNYGLVAVGVDGVGSVGIQVAGSDSVMMNDEGEFAKAQGDGQPFDFCLVSSETVGWLNHYANEVAYNRAILAPRAPDVRREWGTGPIGQNGMCAQCNGGLNGSGSCDACKRQQCSSPYLTFEQWMAMDCASCRGNKNPPIQRVGEKIREGIQKLDERFENAFYRDSGSNGISGGNGQPYYGQGIQGGYGAAVPQQNFQAPAYPAQGYPTPAQGLPVPGMPVQGGF